MGRSLGVAERFHKWIMASGKKCGVCKVAALLAALGAINWGLVGVFNLNLVAALLGEGMGARIVYGVIGVAGVLTLLGSVCCCCPCQKGSCEPKKS
ncbi:MAG: DUF378 domain-containing protein [Candidatus Omnitrophica bacterium]|nr:DUF378 domain-containing protein [Candidatus Omnitrophota bacterium]